MLCQGQATAYPWLCLQVDCMCIIIKQKLKYSLKSYKFMPPKQFFLELNFINYSSSKCPPWAVVIFFSNIENARVCRISNKADILSCHDVVVAKADIFSKSHSKLRAILCYPLGQSLPQHEILWYT